MSVPNLNGLGIHPISSFTFRKAKPKPASKEVAIAIPVELGYEPPKGEPDVELSKYGVNAAKAENRQGDVLGLAKTLVDFLCDLDGAGAKSYLVANIINQTIYNAAMDYAKLVPDDFNFDFAMAVPRVIGVNVDPLEVNGGLRVQAKLEGVCRFATFLKTKVAEDARLRQHLRDNLYDKAKGYWADKFKRGFAYVQTLAACRVSGEEDSIDIDVNLLLHMVKSSDPRAAPMLTVDVLKDSKIQKMSRTSKLAILYAYKTGKLPYQLKQGDALFKEWKPSEVALFDMV